MARQRGALLALLVETWSGAALAEGPDSPGARREARHLAGLPPVIPAVGCADPSGRKQQGRVSCRTIAPISLTGRWPMGSR